LQWNSLDLADSEVGTFSLKTGCLEDWPWFVLGLIAIICQSEFFDIYFTPIHTITTNLVPRRDSNPRFSVPMAETMPTTPRRQGEDDCVLERLHCIQECFWGQMPSFLNIVSFRFGANYMYTISALLFLPQKPCTHPGDIITSGSCSWGGCDATCPGFKSRMPFPSANVNKGLIKKIA
jgi:hypothetical protein